MTAVAPPLTTFQASARTGWNSMNSDDVSSMFTPATRKTVQRQNSSSSLASTSSASSTTSTATVTASAPAAPPAAAAQINGAAPAVPSEPGSWAARKKARGLWPPGKAEPATGISTARPLSINSATSGPSATSGLSAIQAPLNPSPHMANSSLMTNGLRNQAPQAPPVILHLLPVNNTFERKTITVPYYPDVLRIGRQTNQKTIPTPLNGYFDSKVLSRQHAEIYADRDGRIFIRDVKSSNGTFVNSERLSPENRESEPRELCEGNTLELGIDIVSEDQKTVVHHKVSAKVEHAGFYGQNDPLNFGDIDPSNGNGGQLVNGPSPLRRNGSQGSLAAGRGALTAAMTQAANGGNAISQQQHMRNWLNPISMEHIVKKLHAELKYAEQQSKDLERARQAIEAMLNGSSSPTTADRKDASTKSNSEKARPSPTKSKSDLRAHFSAPTAPPPSAPLPQKPDVARALPDQSIQPLLRRSDTARPHSESMLEMGGGLIGREGRMDHSSETLRLYEELKAAKGENNQQGEKIRDLEKELKAERDRRESAESLLERGEVRRDSPRDSYVSPNGIQQGEAEETITNNEEGPQDHEAQITRMQVMVNELKRQVEAFRLRAETAEVERDEARMSLQEMIEAKRRENGSSMTTGQTGDTGNGVDDPSKPSSIARSQRSTTARPPHLSRNISAEDSDKPVNGAPVPSAPQSPTSDVLLSQAGVEEGRPITPEQARLLTQFLAQEILRPGSLDTAVTRKNFQDYHGREMAGAAQ